MHPHECPAQRPRTGLETRLQTPSTYPSNERIVVALPQRGLPELNAATRRTTKPGGRVALREPHPTIDQSFEIRRLVKVALGMIKNRMHGRRSTGPTLIVAENQDEVGGVVGSRGRCDRKRGPRSPG